MANWPIAVILCVFCLGFEAKQVHVGSDLTILIDSKEYFELYKTHRSAKDDFRPNQNASELCSDSENEVYEKCGKKCMLGCRFDSSALKIAADKDECDKSDCIAGCFCKDGLIRHQDKCIPATDCPTTLESLRSNKAFNFGTEDSHPFAKHFGLFKKTSGCGPSGCGTSTTTGCGSKGCGVHIHNHNEVTNGSGGWQMI